MRLLRFSNLFYYFSSIQNKKKALFFINLGIFLSVFAFSSAVISLIIEDKINKKEFELIETQISLRESNSFREKIPQILDDLKTFEQYTKENEAFDQIISSTNLRYRLISREDFYLHQYLGIKIFIEFKDIFELNKLIKPQIDTIPIDEKGKEYFKSIIDDSEKKITNGISIFKKDNLELRKDLFHSSYKNLLSDFVLESYYGEKNMTDYENQLYEDNKELKEIYHSLLKYFIVLETVFSISEQFSDLQINEINKEISKLSKFEKQLILLAFGFQFIIFIIIQFFEITSLTSKKKILKK